MGEYEAITFLTDVSYESRLEGLKILHSELKANKNKASFSDNFEISRGLSVAIFDKEMDVRIQALCFVNDFISSFQGNQDNCIHTLIPALLHCLEDPRSGVQMNAIKVLKKCLSKARNFQNALDKVIIEGIYSKSKKRSLSSINKIHFIVEEHKDSRSLSRLIQALFNQINNKHLQSAVFNALKNMNKGVDEKLYHYWCQNIPQEAMKTYNFMKKTGRVPSASSTHHAKSEDSLKDISDYDKPSHADSTVLYGILPQALCDQLSADQAHHTKQEAYEKMRKLLEMHRHQPALLQHLPDLVDFMMRTFDVSNTQINSLCAGILHHLITEYHSHLKSSIHTLIFGLMPFTCTKISQLKDNIYKLLVSIFNNIDPRYSFNVLSQFLTHSKVKLRQEAFNILIIILLSIPLDQSMLLEWVAKAFESLLDTNRFVRQAAMECCAVLASLVGGKNNVVSSTLEGLEVRQGGRGVTEAFESRMEMSRMPRYSNSDGCVEYVSISNCACVLEWVLLAGVHEQPDRANSTGCQKEDASGGVFKPQEQDEILNGNSAIYTLSSSSSLPKMDHLNNTTKWKASKQRRSYNHSSDEQSSNAPLRNSFNNLALFPEANDECQKGGDGGREGGRMMEWMAEMLDRRPLEHKRVCKEVKKKQPLKVDYNNNLLMNKESEGRVQETNSNELFNRNNSNNNINNNNNNNNNSNNNCNNHNETKAFTNLRHSNSRSHTNSQHNEINLNNNTHHFNRVNNNNNINAFVPNGKISWDETVVGGRRGPCEEYDRVEGEDEEEVEDYATLGQKKFAGRPHFSMSKEGTIDLASHDDHYNHPTTGSSSTPSSTSITTNFTSLSSQSIPSSNPSNLSLDQHSSTHLPHSSKHQASDQAFKEHSFKHPSTFHRTKQPNTEQSFDSSGDPCHTFSRLGNHSFHDTFNHSRRISVVQIEMADNPSLNKPLHEKDHPKGKKSNSGKGDSSKHDGNGCHLNVQEIIQTLNSDNWKSEVACLDRVAQVCQHNPQNIYPHLQPLTQAVVNEVRNLRSNVSRSAIKCLTELFRHLRQDMEPVVEKTMMELLCRVGQPSNFMKEEAIKCMQEVVANISPTKSLQVLINHGSVSKNVSIKNVSSQLILSLCSRLGAHEILCRSPKDFTAKILNKTAQYLVDGSPEVRANGRRILILLRPHQEFDKSLRYHVSHEVITRNIDPVLRNMQSRGDIDSLTSFSAHQRSSPYRHNSGKQTRYHSAGNLYAEGGSNFNLNNNSNSVASMMTATHPAPKGKKAQRFTRVDEDTMENIDKVLGDLRSSDYRLRWAGLDLLSQLVLSHNKTSSVAVHINKVFDNLVPCLKDRNFKVKIHALETLNNLLTPLSPHLNNVINMTVAAITTNLASSNKEVHANAVAVLDTCAKVLDPGVLLSSMVTSTINANVRYKVEMIERVSDLVSQLPPQRHKIISLLVLPLLWQLLPSCANNSGVSSPLYKSTCRLANEIKLILADGLMDAACINSKVTLSMRESLALMLSL